MASRPQAILEDVAKSGLSAEHAEEMRLYLASDDELSSLNRVTRVPVMAIPYFDLAGEPIEFTRYRYLADPRSSWEKTANVKAQRYFQAAGTVPHAYFAPLVGWEAVASNSNIPLLITEGEKKAACGCANGFATIGIGGVWNFIDKVKDDILPELKEFDWKGREVTIIYDSDMETNPAVIMACVRLGEKLMALKAEVKIAHLPQGPNGEKFGLDDYIVAHGKDALKKIINAANSDLLQRQLALHAMNAEFTILEKYAKVVRIEDRAFLDRTQITGVLCADRFHTEVRTSGDKAKVTQVSTADEWMKWPERAKVYDAAMLPGKPVFVEDGGKTYINLWRGWGADPEDGDISIWNDYLSHLFRSTPEEDRRWFEQWLAYPLQNPGVKHVTAVCLWSVTQGNGKSTVLEVMRRIYGVHYIGLSDAQMADTRFEWATEATFVGFDDVVALNNDKLEARWRGLITGSTLWIDKKYVPGFRLNAPINFMFTSNDANVLRVPPQDRRFFIHEVPQWLDNDLRKDFFQRFYHWLDYEGGAGKILHHLLKLDLSTFTHGAHAPMTAAKQAMIELSRTDVGRWCRDLVEAPDEYLRIGMKQLAGDLWTSQDLSALFNATTDPKYRTTANQITRELRNAGAKPYRDLCTVKTKGNRTLRLWMIRNVKHWEDKLPRFAAEHYEQTRMKGGDFQ